MDDGVGDGIEQSCEGKEEVRMAVITMIVLEFIIIDTGEQPLDNVRNTSNLPKKKNNRRTCHLDIRKGERNEPYEQVTRYRRKSPFLRL